MKQIVGILAVLSILFVLGCTTEKTSTVSSAPVGSSIESPNIDASLQDLNSTELPLPDDNVSFDELDNISVD